MLSWYKNKYVDENAWEGAEVFYFLEGYVGIVYSDGEEYWNIDFLNDDEEYVASVSANLTLGGLVDSVFAEKSQCEANLKAYEEAKYPTPANNMGI